MARNSRAHRNPRAVLLAAALLLIAGDSSGQILPWEVTVAEIESGRLRHLAQRLNKEYLLYQLRLGDISKADLVETSERVDHILESLQRGSPPHSIPSPWKTALRERLDAVDAAWGPLRRIAVASPYELLKVQRDFMPDTRTSADPLLIRHFDNLTLDLVAECEKLLSAYHEECLLTGLEVCETARSSGFAAMLIERAAKEAVHIVSGYYRDENRKKLQATIDAYHEVRRANDENPFFAAALNPDRGVSARAAGELLVSLRTDWDSLQREFGMLTDGDEENFDLRALLTVQVRLVEKVERLTAALVRYASLTYGS